MFNEPVDRPPTPLTSLIDTRKSSLSLTASDSYLAKWLVVDEDVRGALERSDHMTPERLLLIDAVLTLPETSLERECQRNLLSNTRTELEIDLRKLGFPGYTQAMRPGLRRAFEILRTASSSSGGRIQRPIYSSSCATGCATIGRESGF